MMVRQGLGRLAAVCLAVAILAAPAGAQDTISTLAAWGGMINSFQRVGNIGYCGMGQRFVVLDMANEASIHELGSITLPSTVLCVVVRGNYAFVTHGAEFVDPIMVIDVSNPASPQIVWREAPSIVQGI